MSTMTLEQVRMQIAALGYNETRARWLETIDDHLTQPAQECVHDWAVGYGVHAYCNHCGVERDPKPAQAVDVGALEPMIRELCKWPKDETFYDHRATRLACAEKLRAFIRTHHATLADMAKRLEAAEMDAGKCWALHFKGPDDVVAAPSREAAEIAAHNFNAFWDAHKHLRAHDVRVVAEVIEWEHGAVEHAKSAAEHWPEYADLLNAAIDATQEGEG